MFCNRLFFFQLLFILLITNRCTFPKTVNMKFQEELNNSCDIETGVCEPVNSYIKKNIEKTVVDQKVKVRYYYDALCGWCYGFSPVIEQLKKEYKEQVEIEVISGGLFLGNRAGYVNDVAPHIKSGAYKSVEDLTGVKFGKPFLDDVFGEGEMVLNSLPPTIALCIVREKFPEKELEFAETLLRAVYYDGINPIEISEYEKYIVELGMDMEEFTSKMLSTAYKEMAQNDFLKFRQSPFSGMPSLVLVKNKNEIPLSNGYMDYNRLQSRLGQLID